MGSNIELQESSESKMTQI